VPLRQDLRPTFIFICDMFVLLGGTGTAPAMI